MSVSPTSPRFASASRHPPRSASSVGFAVIAGALGEGERRGGGGSGYGATKEELKEWARLKEIEDDVREEARRKMVAKDREFIEKINATKRPWRKAKRHDVG